MVFKPMTCPQQNFYSKTVNVKSLIRLETLEEAKERLGREYAIYEDDLRYEKWKIFYVKDNLLISELIDKKVKLLQEKEI